MSVDAVRLSGLQAYMDHVLAGYVALSLAWLTQAPVEYKEFSPSYGYFLGFYQRNRPSDAAAWVCDKLELGTLVLTPCYADVRTLNITSYWESKLGFFQSRLGELASAVPPYEPRAGSVPIEKIDTAVLAPDLAGLPSALKAELLGEVEKAHTTIRIASVAAAVVGAFLLIREVRRK